MLTIRYKDIFNKNKIKNTLRDGTVNDPFYFNMTTPTIFLTLPCKWSHGWPTIQRSIDNRTAASAVAAVAASETSLWLWQKFSQRCMIGCRLAFINPYQATQAASRSDRIPWSGATLAHGATLSNVRVSVVDALSSEHTWAAVRTCFLYCKTTHCPQK